MQKPPSNHQGAQMSLPPPSFFLPSGYCCVGEAGGSKHSPGKQTEKTHNQFPVSCDALWDAGFQGDLRDVSQGVLEFSAQIPHVLPLLLRQTLAAHVDVLHSQLLLVEKPLHNKERG